MIVMSKSTENLSKTHPPQEKLVPPDCTPAARPPEASDSKAERDLARIGFDGALVMRDGEETDTDAATKADQLLQKVAETFKRTKRNQIAAILEMGSDLRMAKTLGVHGDFEQTVEEKTEICPRTARNYMSAAGCFGGKTEIVSELTATALYKLSGKSAAKYREEFIKKRNEGESISSKTVIAEINASAKSSKTPGSKKRSSEATGSPGTARTKGEQISMPAESSTAEGNCVTSPGEVDPAATATDLPHHSGDHTTCPECASIMSELCAAGIAEREAVLKWLGSHYPTIAAEFDALSHLAAETGAPSEHAAQ